MGFPVESVIDRLFQFDQVVRAELSQVMLFRVGPECFNRIEFRGIGREVFEVEVSSVGQVRLRERGTVSLKSIPQQNDGSAKVPLQLSQDRHDHGIVNRIVRPQEMVAIEPAPVRRDADHADRRDAALMLELMPQDRPMSPRRPGALDRWQHQKATFVPENDHRALPVRFFLMRGQSHCCQCSISAAFRSRARCSGFWGVKFSDLSKVGM